MKIGDKVKFHTCYSVKARQRLAFNYTSNSSHNQIGLTEISIHPCEGFYIGYRYLRMENAIFETGKIYNEDGDCSPSYLTGPVEKCLLVVFNERRNPVAVRLQDII